MKFIRLHIWLLGISCFLLPAFGNAAEPVFAQAQTLFEQALQEQDGALDQALRQFEALSEQHPENPVYRAYLGACMTLLGRDAWMPWNKMRYTEHGLDKLDQALKTLDERHDNRSLAGTSLRLQTMLIAATTFLNLPEHIFHRHARGARILGKIMHDPKYTSSSAAFKKAVADASTLAHREA